MEYRNHSSRFVKIVLTLIFWTFIISISQAEDKDSLDIGNLQLCYGYKHYIYPINTNESLVYEKPEPFHFLLNAPKDVTDYTRNTFQMRNWKEILGMSALTAILVAVDQDITNGAKNLGRKIGIKGDNNMKTVANVFGFPIQTPTDLSSGLYFIGDGWTHGIITTSFFAYGLFKSDTRALQTASQLAEGLITVAFSTQLLKHITGRESPFVSTRRGGRWDLFPNQIDYHKHVPEYDAFPSGHLASAMMVVTVISENYKEYKFVRPLGYSLMTILAFQMLNNGVHWASDYPLALAMGYSFGKLAVSRGRRVIKKKEREIGKVESIDFGFGVLNMNGIGINCRIILR